MSEQNQQPTPEAAAQAAPADAPPAETLTERYLRETRDSIATIRTATVTVAWIVVLAAIGAVITGIITAVQISHLVNLLNQPSNCVPGINC